MMGYVSRLANLMIEVMLPLTILVGAGAFWSVKFRDIGSEHLATHLNRLVLYLFYPCILFAIAATTPITFDLVSVPLLNGIGSLLSGAILYLVLYRTRIGQRLADSTRAVLMVGGMFGNTFNIGVPVLVFFFGPDAARYAVFNDMLMTNPLIWSLGVWICTRLGSQRDAAKQDSAWRILFSMPPIWAFIFGIAVQQLGLVYMPLIAAARMIGQATIPIFLFVLGMSIPWRKLTPRPAILIVAAVKLLITPLLAWVSAKLFYPALSEAQYAAVLQAATPTMVTTLVLADRFRLDTGTAALLIGWSTILFWFTLPLLMALGLTGP